MSQKTLRSTVKLLLFILLIGWGLLVVPALVNADGESRPATREEKEFYKTVKTTLARALPANGPAGWDEVSRSVVEELVSLGMGEVASAVGGLPLRVDYLVSWQDSEQIHAAEEETQKALFQQDVAQQAQPDSVELDKLYGQMEKLGNELEKAINAGDMDKAMTLMVEMEEISAKISGISEVKDTEQDELLEKMASHDVKAGIFAVVNSFTEEFYRPVKREDPIAGGLVYRSEGKFSPERGWEEGYTFIFLGNNWKFIESDGYGFMEATVNKGLPNLTVQTVVVRIQADPARTRELMGKIDWGLLKGLINNAH